MDPTIQKKGERVQFLKTKPGFRSLYALKKLSMESFVPFAQELLQGTEQWIRFLAHSEKYGAQNWTSLKPND